MVVLYSNLVTANPAMREELKRLKGEMSKVKPYGRSHKAQIQC